MAGNRAVCFLFARNIVLFLAKCHAAFPCSRPCKRGRHRGGECFGCPVSLDADSSACPRRSRLSPRLMRSMADGMAGARADGSGPRAGPGERHRLTGASQAPWLERRRVRPSRRVRDKPALAAGKAVLRAGAGASPAPERDAAAWTGGLPGPFPHRKPSPPRGGAEAVARVFLSARFPDVAVAGLPGISAPALPFARDAGRQTGRPFGAKLAFLYGPSKVFPCSLADFQYACSGRNDVHSVCDKNQGLVAIILEDVLPQPFLGRGVKRGSGLVE